jgi:hypothetical protein
MVGENVEGGATAAGPKKRSKLMVVLYILIALVLLIAVFLGVAALQPSDFRVSRSATISAPPSEIFPHVNELSKWQAWSPYDKRDPALKRTYSGPDSGTGASYHWNGNKQVGEGTMKIIESHPNELVKIDLHFIRPFEGTSIAAFTFEPEGAGTTRVTWNLEGKHTLIPKAMGLIMSMDKMIGSDFEAGLRNLKSVVEASPVK